MGKGCAGKRPGFPLLRKSNLLRVPASLGSPETPPGGIEVDDERPIPVHDLHLQPLTVNLNDLQCSEKRHVSWLCGWPASPILLLLGSSQRQHQHPVTITSRLTLGAVALLCTAGRVNAWWLESRRVSWKAGILGLGRAWHCLGRPLHIAAADVACTMAWAIMVASNGVACTSVTQAGQAQQASIAIFNEGASQVWSNPVAKQLAEVRMTNVLLNLCLMEIQHLSSLF